MTQHRVVEAYKHYRKAYASMSSFFGSDHPLTKMAAHKLQTAQRHLKQHATTKAIAKSKD